MSESDYRNAIETAAERAIESNEEMYESNGTRFEMDVLIDIAECEMCFLVEDSGEEWGYDRDFEKALLEKEISEYYE